MAGLDGSTRWRVDRVAHMACHSGQGSVRGLMRRVDVRDQEMLPASSPDQGYNPGMGDRQGRELAELPDCTDPGKRCCYIVAVVEQTLLAAEKAAT